MNKFESILEKVVPFILEHSVSYPRHYASFKLAHGAFLSEFRDEISQMKLTEKAAAIAGCPFADEVGDYGVAYPVSDLDDAVSQALLQMLMQASAPALRKIVEEVYREGISLDLLRLGREVSVAASMGHFQGKTIADRLEPIMRYEVVPDRSLPVDFPRAIQHAANGVLALHERHDNIRGMRRMSREERDRLRQVTNDVATMLRERGNWIDVVHEMLLSDIDEARRTHEREVREFGSCTTLENSDT